MADRQIEKRIRQIGGGLMPVRNPEEVFSILLKDFSISIINGCGSLLERDIAAHIQIKIANLMGKDASQVFLEMTVSESGDMYKFLAQSGDQSISFPEGDNFASLRMISNYCS
jgi:hypothetical protein